LIGLFFILGGSITLIGYIGDLRVLTVEKQSYENIFGVFLLFSSLLVIIFSFITYSFSNNHDKSKFTFFLQITSLLLIVLAGFSYFFFAQEVITEISNTLIVENLHIAHSTLLGTFGFIIALIITGLSLSISKIRKIAYDNF
jgi:lysylphosphatidylglycerol synthetase-like protein (DUF2156 family)